MYFFLSYSREKSFMEISYSDEKSFRIWVKDENCNKLDVRFALPHSIPMCGLVSFPGSGNTWLRRLIEASTGLFTGSLYDDTELFMRGLYYVNIVLNIFRTFFTL